MTAPRTDRTLALPVLAARTAALLAGHVPLTLLLDLAGPPPSQALYRSEEPDLSWLDRRED